MLNNKIKISILALICCFSNINAEWRHLGVVTITTTSELASGPTTVNPIWGKYSAYYCVNVFGAAPPRTTSFYVNDSTNEVDMQSVYSPDKLKISGDDMNHIFLKHSTEVTYPDTSSIKESTFYFSGRLPNSYTRTTLIASPLVISELNMTVTCVSKSEEVGTPVYYVPEKKDSTFINFLRGKFKEFTTPDPSKVKRKKRIYVGEERG